MSELNRKLRKRHQSILTFSKHKKCQKKYGIRPGKYLKVTVKKGSFRLQQLLT